MTDMVGMKLIRKSLLCVVLLVGLLASNAKGVQESNCDGVFIDQMHGNVGFRNENGKETKVAMGEMMSQLKDELGKIKSS